MSRVMRCTECNGLMEKRGAGLGKWHCKTNSRHNSRSVSQTKGPGGGDGKTTAVRTVFKRYGRAVRSAK